MLLYLFVAIAVASSFAEADDYVCFDPQKFIKKVAQPVHVACKGAIDHTRKVEKVDCDFAYFIYRSCHFRGLGINNKYQEIDNAKKKEKLNKLSECGKDSLVHNGNIQPYLDCLEKLCPEIKEIRADFSSSATGNC
uniref:Uncharacterized protein n=1 Tax=Strigamia maritima TaxID=126957 RepID=T1ILH9_STRMM